MKTQQGLSDEQERLRIEGLRALARIIARRALASHDRTISPSTGERLHVPLDARDRPRRNRTA